MTSILVVDDDATIVRTLSMSLRAHGYLVQTAVTGEAALQSARTDPPDLMLLDLGLPDLSGVEVLTRLRRDSVLPVIVVSARHTSEDKVAALDAGGDDYVTKPVGIDELLARIRAVVRRRPAPAPTIETDHLRIDLQNLRVWRDGEEVRLTPTEWGVLRALVTSPGRLVPQRQLLHDVWGSGYEKETNYLRVYMSNLRRKLEVDASRPRHLITEPGMGYRFLL